MIQAAEYVEQCRFARAGSTHDCHHGTSLNSEVDIIEDVNALLIYLKLLIDIGQFKNRFLHGHGLKQPGRSIFGADFLDDDFVAFFQTIYYLHSNVVADTGGDHGCRVFSVFT